MGKVDGGPILLKRIAAIGFIFVCATVAWMILAAGIWSRTNSSEDKLLPGVASTWGAPQEQVQPVAVADDPLAASGNPTSGGQPKSSLVRLDAERTRVNADLALEYRQKGLLWYSTYVVQFNGSYRFRNSSNQPQRITLNFLFPAQQALYDDLSITESGRALPFSAGSDGAAASVILQSGQTADFRVSYRSHGLDSWRYGFGKEVKQTRDFELALKTNFDLIDFPANTLSPTEKHSTGNGWELEWRYRNLISGFEIGMAMPERLQPGPLAGEISAFAPVSLLLFFFVLFTLTTLRGVDLHPMNYFFLAAAFFAFHLLLAYSVDHISIQLAFVLSSLVSVGLVVSYLRVVIGPRFAVLEAGMAQFVYLVLFSFSFFLKGFTGLAITVGCIVTLFVAMQITARVRWRDHFALQPARS